MKKLTPRRFFKFIEIYRVIKKYKPCDVLEYGYGLTSYFFFHYFKVHFKTLEEDLNWLYYYKERMPMIRDVDIVLASRRTIILRNTRVCYYDIDHDVLDVDMVYVDGPNNFVDGEYLPCVDVYLMKHKPRLVLIDGRSSTVDFLNKYFSGYRMIIIGQHTLFVKE